MSNVEFEFLGPYKVESILGRGGMGTVYKGSHSRSGEQVAIKVIATGVATQSRFRRRFAAEVETLKRLKHPHIVQLIGYGEEHGLLFYSMEYVDGHSLHDHLRQHRSLPWEDVLQVGIETAAALKHAHDIGIIHRDLKPANLMLNVQGQIKLTDFGIAKLFGSTDMTAAGSVIGTADYMSPEQAEGKAVNSRSDLYSLGCVLYALMAGRPPFGGKSVPEVLYAVRYNPVPSLSEKVPNCPPELAHLIEELLNKEPLNRPPTALVVGNRLKAIQQGMMKKSGGPSQLDTHATQIKPKVGSELTSLDLSDSDDNELRLTNPDGSSMREQPTMLAPQNSFVSDEDRTSDVTKLPLPDASSSSPSPAPNTLPSKPAPLPAAAAQPATAGWISGSARHSEDDYVTSGGPSHFTHVSDSGEARYASHGELVDPHQRDWLQYVSIAGMVVLLIGSIFIGWRMMQPSSADAIYREVSAAIETGDDSQLLDARPRIEEFIHRFPDDPRAAELKDYRDDAELTKAVRLLQRKAAKAGGKEELGAVEQAFLRCMQMRDRDYPTFRQQLSAFLSVYGKVQDLEPAERKLVELASFARHAQPAKQNVPRATAQLEKLIRSAEGALSGAELTKFYESLLVLYNGDSWAEEQLIRIRNRIKSDAIDDKK
jgi:serine/threonine protein kinase